MFGSDDYVWCREVLLEVSFRSESVGCVVVRCVALC